MATPPPSKNQSEHDPPPGAERFWGQFSQAGNKGKAGPESGPANGSADAAGEHSGHGHECLEWCPICRSAELLRHTLTPELAQQVLTLQKEAAGVLKAFILAYSEKAEDSPGGPGSATGSAPGDGSGHNGGHGEDDPGPRVTDITID